MEQTVGSLFSGIGGMDLGLERAGWEVQWQVERDAYCRQVLQRHWPNVKRRKNVEKATRDHLPPVTLIAGGFPCQDLSTAKTATPREGLRGMKSGLWREFARIVGECEPRWVLVENVAATWRQWVPQVRRDLHALGYPSLPVFLYAATCGAPFLRKRCFVVARTDRDGESARALHAQTSELSTLAKTRRRDWGTPPPAALGVDDGTPAGVERRRAVGNACIPLHAEWLGRSIIVGEQAVS